MMPTPRVLANVVDQLDAIDMADRDTKGDLYEYILGKIASAGQNGQFRTPRHIRLMVEMTAPTPKDVICDPACGTAGFLIAASEHLVAHHSDSIYKTEESRKKFNSGTFHGYDFDSTTLGIGSMNSLLHGVENPDIRYRDSLAQSAGGGKSKDAHELSVLVYPQVHKNDAKVARLEDMAAVGNLSRGDPADWVRAVREVLQFPDSPISLRGKTWMVKNREALWELLATRLFSEHLKMLGKIARVVLSESDPQFELDREQRFAAAVYGKTLEHSQALRRGMAETLALLGCKGALLTNCPVGDAGDLATIVIREILHSADWMRWGSLNDLLPLLAEASPTAFLDAVEHALSSVPCPFDRLFAEEGGAMGGRNYVTGLLWALEVLAWEDQFLVRGTVSLARSQRATREGNSHFYTFFARDEFEKGFLSNSAARKVLGQARVLVQTVRRGARSIIAGRSEPCTRWRSRQPSRRCRSTRSHTR